jgi:hypothetical protein
MSEDREDAVALGLVLEGDMIDRNDLAREPRLAGLEDRGRDLAPAPRGARAGRTATS